MLKLLLQRFAYLPTGTFGELKLPDGNSFMTVERPWLDNIPFDSCIPEGVYSLGYRASQTFSATTKGKFLSGFEVKDVPGRSGILIHPGNWPSSVQGCIAVGKTFIAMKDPKSDSLYAVSSSQAAFADFMEKFKPGTYMQIEISSLKAIAK